MSLPVRKVYPPKIKVHYIYPVAVRVVKETETAAVRRLNQRRFFIPIILATALGVGALGGGLAVWESQFGLADDESSRESIEQPIEQLVEQTAEPTAEPIPLEFDQSELNIVADFLPVLIEENRHEPRPEELEQQKYEQRREALRKYFQSRKSPFAKDDKTLDAFLTSKNMKLMIAISFVESTMGQRCYYHNCSGIGGYPPNLRKYPDYAGWIVDFDSLLERRYKGLPIEKFLGLYVQPGSPQWLYGVKQILAELKQAEIE